MVPQPNWGQGGGDTCSIKSPGIWHSNQAIWRSLFAGISHAISCRKLPWHHGSISLDSSMYCTLSCPCNEGEGCCNGNSDCAGSLVCGRNNCQGMFRSSTDCCSGIHLPSPLPTYIEALWTQWHQHTSANWDCILVFMRPCALHEVTKGSTGSLIDCGSLS